MAGKGWEAIIGDTNPDKKGKSAGVAGLAKKPNTISAVKALNKGLQPFIDAGRCGIYCIALPGGTAIYCYNIYAWTGSETREEERQLGEDMFSEILADKQARPEVATLIFGDYNAN